MLIINISLSLFKHITTSTTEFHIHHVLMVLKCIEVLTSYGHDCKKDIDMLNTSSQFAYTMQLLLLIASIKMIPDELQCYCKCCKKKAISLYTLSAFLHVLWTVGRVYSSLFLESIRIFKWLSALITKQSCVIVQVRT